jgi:hypothetical protein
VRPFEYDGDAPSALAVTKQKDTHWQRRWQEFKEKASRVLP